MDSTKKISKLKKYGKALVYNPNINKKNILCVGLILATLFIIIFHISRHVLETSSFAQGINGICVVSCKNSEPLKKFVKTCKGSDYWLDSGDCKFEYDCFMSIWELTHIYLHIIIGYYLDLRYSLAIGVGFEFYERYSYNCENLMDIIWNTLGCVIGGTCRYIKQN